MSNSETKESDSKRQDRDLRGCDPCGAHWDVNEMGQYCPLCGMEGMLA